MVGFVAGNTTMVGAMGTCAACTGSTYSATSLDDASCCQAHTVCGSSRYVSVAGTSHNNSVCAAKKPDGDTCLHDTQCTNTVCKTGRCCDKSNGVSAGCLACGPDGQCIKCSNGNKLENILSKLVTGWRYNRVCVVDDVAVKAASDKIEAEARAKAEADRLAKEIVDKAAADKAVAEKLAAAKADTDAKFAAKAVADAKAAEANAKALADKAAVDAKANAEKAIADANAKAVLDQKAAADKAVADAKAKADAKADAEAAAGKAVIDAQNKAKLDAKATVDKEKEDAKAQLDVKVKAAAEAKKTAKAKAGKDAKAVADIDAAAAAAATYVYTIDGSLLFTTIATPDDFTPAMQAGLKTTLAAKCGASSDNVTLVVTAVRRRRYQRHQRRRLSSGGGVNVAYSVRVDSKEAADQGKEALTAISAGGDTAVISFIAALKANAPHGTFAFVDVDSITVTAPVVKSTRNDNGDKSKSPVGNLPIFAIAAGAGGGVVLITVIIAALACRRRTAANRARSGGNAVISPRTSSAAAGPAAADETANDKRSVELSVRVVNPILARTQSVGFDGDDGGGGPEEAAEPKAASREDVSSTSWTKALRLEEKKLRAKKEEFGLDTVEKARLKFLARVKRIKKRSDSTRRLIARESSDKAEAEL